MPRFTQWLTALFSPPTATSQPADRSGHDTTGANDQADRAAAWGSYLDGQEPTNPQEAEWHDQWRASEPADGANRGDATIYDAEYGPGSPAGKAEYIEAASEQAEQLRQNMYDAMDYENTPTTDEDGWTDEYPDDSDSLTPELAYVEHLAANPALADDPRWSASYEGLDGARREITEAIERREASAVDEGRSEGLAQAEADLEALQDRLDGNSSDEPAEWHTHSAAANQQSPPWGDLESADLGKAEAAEMVKGPLPQDHTTVGGVDGSFNTDTGLYVRSPDACLAGDFNPHTGEYTREEQAAADIVALAGYADELNPHADGYGGNGTAADYDHVQLEDAADHGYQPSDDYTGHDQDDYEAAGDSDGS